MFIALVIAVIITVAVLSSFFMPIIFGGTPAVVLPNVSALIDDGQDPDGIQNLSGDSYVRVGVTTETVQSVIATLDRPSSYYRVLSVAYIWGEEASEQSTTEMQVWMDGGFTKVETKLPGGLVRHCIVDKDTRYVWYGNDNSYDERKSDKLTADLEQRMPTYEDVLALDMSTITDTGYEMVDGLSCIYVEVADDTMGYLERYWVEVQSGLLVAAETVKGGMVVYRMTSDSDTMEFPIPQDASFMLPDGTVLHEVVTDLKLK